MVWRSLNFESALRFFLLISDNKRYQGVHENFISCFLRKKSHLGKYPFWSFFNDFVWVWSKLSQVTVTIDSLKSQDMIKTLK